MLQRRFVLEPDSGYPLHITAKQYWRTEWEAHSTDPDAFTLILLHSTSFHKEILEPTLQHLFDNVHARRNDPTTPKIKSAWIIECPNHGESAALNESALQQAPFHRTFGCERYADAVHRFMHCGPVDFRRERLLGIGHSLGGVGISILPTLDPAIPFCALVLIEPMLSPGGLGQLQNLKESLIRGAYERRDAWPSRENASTYFRKKTRWDAGVLDRYIQHGLRAHQGSVPGVTLACSREEEAMMYRDTTGPARGIAALDAVCTTTPVGVIFGEKNDYIPRHVQDALVDPASGRRFQSVRRVRGVGHLVPQHAPAELSRVILEVWIRLVTPVNTASKL